MQQVWRKSSRHGIKNPSQGHHAAKLQGAPFLPLYTSIPFTYNVDHEEQQGYTKRPDLGSSSKTAIYQLY